MTVRRGPRAPRARLRSTVAAAVLVVAALLISEGATFGPGAALRRAGRRVGLAAVFVAVHRPAEPLSILIALAALIGGSALFGAALSVRDAATLDANDCGSAIRAVAVALFPAVGLHLALGVPDGLLRSTARRVTVLLGYAASGACRASPRATVPTSRRAGRDRVRRVAVVALVGYLARYRRASSVHERARLQWPAWGVVVAGAVPRWSPGAPRAACRGPTTSAPSCSRPPCSSRCRWRSARRSASPCASTGCSCTPSPWPGSLRWWPRATCSSCSGSGARRPATRRRCSASRCSPPRSPRCCGSRSASGSPTSRTRRVYGERHAPDEVIRTFGSRLTRALPLDELLLQLAESLKKTMALSVAEVWTRGTGGLERAVSVPDRGMGRITIGKEEEPVIARAGVSGVAWASIWLPAVLDGDDDVLRVAPITNSGELLGMIVVRRPEGALQFDEDDDQALTELARQVGLALHNVKLDSALQESLDEVRRQADELRASRARIVEAGDAQRRAHRARPARRRAAASRRARGEREPRAPDRRHRSRRRQGDARADRQGSAGSGAGAPRTSRTASTRRC